MIGRDLIRILQDNKLEDAHLSEISYTSSGPYINSVSLYFERFAQDTILIHTRIDIDYNSGKLTARVDDVVGRL